MGQKGIEKTSLCRISVRGATSRDSFQGNMEAPSEQQQNSNGLRLMTLTSGCLRAISRGPHIPSLSRGQRPINPERLATCPQKPR